MTEKKQTVHPLFDSVEMVLGTWQRVRRLLMPASKQASAFSILLKFMARDNPNGY